MSLESPQERRRGRLTALGLLLLFTLLSHGYVDNPDAEVEVQTARSIARRLTTGLSAEHADASAAEVLVCRAGFDVMRGVDGRYYSWFGLGHALVLVPFYAIGAGLAELMPGIEQAHLEARIADLGPELGRAHGEEFFAHLLVSLHSPLFGAGIAWLLFAILGHFGFRGWTRIAAVLLAMLTTQLGPGTRESMGDVTAGFFLLWSVARALAFRTGRRSSAALAAGLLGGFAVLCRPFHVLPLAAIGVYVLVYSIRGRQWRALAGFMAGAAPFGVWLLLFNQLRFGSPFETGYAAGTSEGYWSFPPLLGFLLLALSPGKGMLVFSPVLWVAPRGLTLFGRARRADLALCACVLLAPWILCSFMTGWHSSQAWASRYVSLGAAVLVAIAGAAVLERAGRGWRRALLSLAAAGLLINAGGWLTPYRGFYDLGSRVWTQKWPDAAGGDSFQNFVVHPRMSPTFGHWLYAWCSMTGRIPDGEPEAVYGLVYGFVPDAATARPRYPEDAGFRHLWPIGLSRRFQSLIPAILGLVVAIGTVLVGFRLRRAVRA